MTLHLNRHEHTSHAYRICCSVAALQPQQVPLFNFRGLAMHDQDAADGDNAFEVGACMCEAATPTGVPLCLLLTLVGTCSAAPSQLAKHIVLLCWTATHSRHRYAELCRALAWPQLTVVSCISGELYHGWVLQRMPAFAAGRITTVPLPQHQRQHSAAGVLLLSAVSSNASTFQWNCCAAAVCGWCWLLLPYARCRWADLC